MHGANGLNFCRRLTVLTKSCTASPLGSANKDLLPRALGPYSALPDATPHMPSNCIIDTTSLANCSIGLDGLISYPRKGSFHHKGPPCA